MKKNNKVISHNYFDNMKFMFRELWCFEKKAFFFPVFHIVFDILVAIIGIWLPKIVLDLISNSVATITFVMTVSITTAILMIVKYISYNSQQEMFKSVTRILNAHFYIRKDWKILDMDYSLATSPEGKIKIEKGHDTTGRNIFFNMASFYINFTNLTKNILGFLCFSTILIVLNPIIIIILLVSYLIDAYISYLVHKWEHGTRDKKAKIDNKLYYILDEITSNFFAKDIRAYNMRQWINNKTDVFINEREKLEKQIQTKHLLQELIEVLLFLVINGGAYVFLIWKMLNSDMSIGDFVLFFGVITGFAKWLEEIMKSFKQLTSSLFLVDDYRNLMDTKDERLRGKGRPIPNFDEGIELVLEDVTFKYENSDKNVIDNINLRIRKGEKLALVGANGAGKTTLVKLICGLLNPSSGRILLNGIDIKEFNRDEYYSIITAVFQNVNLLPMSIMENISFCNETECDMELMKNSAKLAGIADRIEGLEDGYNTMLMPHITGSGVNLSGGEIQKLMLARALYKNSPLLILDEPTSALDPIAENQMYQKYNILTQDKTSIFISHRLSSTRFCDRIIYLDNGQICEEGTHDSLMDKGEKYRRLFEIQSHYYKNDRKAGKIC